MSEKNILNTAAYSSSVFTEYHNKVKSCNNGMFKRVLIKIQF